jgi:CheY-like chemotaxis protein
MVLKALLISTDDSAIGILNSVLSEFAMTAQHSSYPAGNSWLPLYKVDALIVDFDDTERAAAIIQSVKSVSHPPVIIAILKSSNELRNALAAGANFALYKPVVEDKARATLQAVAALVKRERRRSFRVPVQVPVHLEFEDGSNDEGVLLDLSEEGLDVLSAKPVRPSSTIRASFSLPDGAIVIKLTGQVAWSNPNGQAGIHISDIEETFHNIVAAFLDRHASEIPSEDPWQDSECKLSDLSLRACYIETVSPFPESSLVQLSLCAHDIEVGAEGKVLVMHPGVGMGIEFASRTYAQRADVQSILNLLTSSPGVVPKLAVRPRALIAPQDFADDTADKLEDPLLQLLRNHESLTQEEFLNELQQQRSTQEAQV